jgi:DNA-binding MarR family transcriptional regulator
MMYIREHMTRKSSENASVNALRRVTAEVVRTFHHLRAASERLHGEADPSASQRGILRGLQRSGAQTVSQMARARLVTRQFVQQLVDSLAEQGLVEVIPNPLHARAHLIQLTAAGRDVASTMERVEDRAYRHLARNFELEDLERAASTMAELCNLLDALPVENLKKET